MTKQAPFKRTTDSEHAWPIAPNIIDQDCTAATPHQKWGVDISYAWTREGWLYLAVVIDLCSRRVGGGAGKDLAFPSPAFSMNAGLTLTPLLFQFGLTAPLLDFG